MPPCSPPGAGPHLLPLSVGLLLLIIAPATARAELTCLGSVCMDAVVEAPTVYFEVLNRTAAPVTVEIHFDEKRNLTPYPKLPERQVVPAGGRRKIAQFVPSHSRARWSYRYRWQWMMGDATARHPEGVRYRVPFGGAKPRMLSQGVDGPFTHMGPHRYAFDFAMPIGTPILAARSGRVVRVSDGHTQHGITDEFLSKANAVYVMHDDRTIATYAHLDPGAGVQEGMRVLAGDVIGFSGNTGFSTGPHLHFEVWRPVDSSQLETLPIRFRGLGGAGFVPLTSLYYPPTCHAEGVPCHKGEIAERERSAVPGAIQKHGDGTCRCPNGSVITTHLPCRMVCPKR